MKKWVRIILSVIAVIFLLAIVVIFFGPDENRSAGPTRPFITANPIDLNQTKAISQFRSCEGHNFSGRNADGIKETYRTMKHYIEVVDSLAQTPGQVKIFAPFDGRVSQISKGPRGSRVHLSPDADTSDWDFLYFHVDLLPKYNDQGTDISAGDHIGYANLIGGANFDFSLRNFGLGSQLNDTPFSYMTEEVLSQYAAAGITLDNIVIPQEERDASPCQLAPGRTGRDATYAQSESGQSWVNVGF